MKKALVVVDCQNDFVTGSLGSLEAISIIPHVCTAIKEAIDRGETVYFTLDTHGEDYLDTTEGKNLPVKHCIKGTKGHDLHDDILATLEGKAEGYRLIEKPTFGSFDLVKALEGVDEVTIMGICTDICVVSNALLIKNAYPDMIITVDSNGCAGVTPKSHQAALVTMAACQVKII